MVTAVAAVSLAIGAALLLAPGPTARALGVESSHRTLRTIGLVDVALAPGLYYGRPQWPWLTARGASNPLIAAVVATSARTKRARILAAGLVGATVMDLRTAARLRSDGR